MIVTVPSRKATHRTESGLQAHPPIFNELQGILQLPHCPTSRFGSLTPWDQPSNVANEQLYGDDT